MSAGEVILVAAALFTLVLSAFFFAGSVWYDRQVRKELCELPPAPWYVKVCERVLGRNE